MALDDLLKLARQKKLQDLWRKTRSWPDSEIEQAAIREAYANEAKQLREQLQEKVKNNIPITPEEADYAKRFQYDFYNVPSKNTYGTKNIGAEDADSLYFIIEENYKKPLKQQQEEASKLFWSIRDDLKRIEDQERRYLTPEEMEIYKSKVKQYFEMPGSDQDKYARISHEADFNERFRRLNRENYEKPLAKIIPLKTQKAVIAAPTLTNPLDYLSELASKYRQSQEAVADAIVERVNPTPMPPDETQKQLGRMAFDPINAIPGAAGFGVGLFTLLPEKKK